ncbi:hypothetical protein Taro_013391, partial [Colocasia esculenta]|nr:hypothetical protein [Colocasia esculenta]
IEGVFRTGFGREKRGPRKSFAVLVRAVWRPLDQGGSSNFKIQKLSRRRNCIRGRFGALEVGGGDCLTDEVGIFGLRFVTPVGGIEASCMETMATRGRRGAVSTQGEGSAGGSQTPAQQAQDQTSVPLPPPPPVDYGALMQGLVHAMQTQAQTTAALQAQVQIQAHAPAHEAVFGGVPMMERFRRMTPPFFKGESDPILAESWLRETEKNFRAIRCAEEERVTLATYMLQERVDVWWSSVLRTQFSNGAMEVAWVEFVRLFRAKYIPEHV